MKAMFSNNTSPWKRTSQRKKHQLDEASKIPSSGLILRSFPGNVVEILINIVVALFDWHSCPSSTSPPHRIFRLGTPFIPPLCSPSTRRERFRKFKKNSKQWKIFSAIDNGKLVNAQLSNCVNVSYFILLTNAGSLTRIPCDPIVEAVFVV